MRIGVFGGSYDPVHYGHLLVADTALEAARLDRVLFVPTAQSPFKPVGPVARDRQRLEMLTLALAGNQQFEPCGLEIERQGTSYTIDTLRQLHELHPNAELFLIMGSDSAEQLDRWKDARQICQMAIPLVAARRGTQFDPDRLSSLVDATRLDEIRKYVFEFPLIEISSSDVRTRLANRRSIRYRVPRSVECYIENASLYQSTAATGTEL